MKALWFTAGVLGFWSFGFTQMMGSDLWWHVAAGRYIVEHGAIFHLTDPWSYTRQGVPWMHHEWLSDVVFDLIRRVAGMEALVYWKWALIVGAYMVQMSSLQRLTGSYAAAYTGALGAAALSAPLLDIRPQLYSFLGFALLVRLTLARERVSWALPAIFLLWANLHGGFFFGLIALPLLCFGKPWSRTLLIWLACIAASMVTPNGLHAFLYPVKLAFDTKSPFRNIGEWRSPFAAGGIAVPLYPYALAVFVASVIAVLAIPALRQRSVPALPIGLLTLAMSLRSRRFVVLYGLAGAIVVAMLLAYVFRRFPANRFPRWALLLPALAAIALGVVRLQPHALTTHAFRSLTLEDSFPSETMDFVDANRISGKVFAYYNWGGYLHLRTAGRLKVYIDGRADTVFDAQTYRGYLDVLLQRAGWRDVIEGSGAELVLWPRNDPDVAQQLTKSGRWRTIHEDTVGQLLSRADLVLPRPVDSPR